MHPQKLDTFWGAYFYGQSPKLNRLLRYSCVNCFSALLVDAYSYSDSAEAQQSYASYRVCFANSDSSNQIKLKNLMPKAHCDDIAGDVK